MHARSTLATVLATVLLAATVSVGAAPAAGAATPVANPDLQPRCGLSIALVLDASGSIQSANAVDKVRGAANALLTSLSGTGSSAAVVQFGTVGQPDAGYTPVTASSVAPSGVLGQALAKYYNPSPALGSRIGRQFNGSGNVLSTSSYTTNSAAGWTNWEDGLLKTREVPGAPGGKADLVVFITDGDPTAVNTQPGYPFYNAANPTGNILTNIAGANQAYSLDPAITAANQLKSAGSKILTVGVGNGLTSAASQTRLKQVSGPDLVNLDTPGATINLTTDDVIVTQSFDKLATAAATIATAVCQSSLTITKRAQSAASNAFDPAPGWRLSVTPTASGGSLSGWISPAGATGSSAATVTDASGGAAFQWKLSSAAATTSLRVQETGQPGFTFNGATCTVRTPGGGVSTTTFTTNPFTIPPVDSTAIVTCEVTNAFTFAPALSLDKSASPTVVRTDAAPPTPVTYTYVARNTGNTPLANVALTDDRCNSISGPTGDGNGNGLLDTTETWTFTCTQNLEGVTVPQVINTAVVRGTDPAGTVVSATDTASVQALAPAIDIAKTASRTVVSPGGAVTYTYVVRNTGNVPLTNATVADDQCRPVTPASVATLPVGGSATFTCATTLAATTLNIATAAGTPPVGPPVLDSASATVLVTPVGIDLTKTANGATGTTAALVHEGDPVTYTFSVRLPAGAAPVAGVALRDSACSPISGPAGDAGTPGTLEQGETWTYTCGITTGAATAGLLPNTATVTGTAVGPGDPVSDSDTALVQVVRPAIKVLKSADPALIHSGEEVTYGYGVTNPGNAPLQVAVSDDRCAPLTRTGGDANGNNLLDTNETWVYRCATALTADTTNTVTAIGTDALGREVSSQAAATADVLNPALALTKAADRSVVRLGPDNIVVYTLSATNTGDADLSGITFTDTTCTTPTITGGDANGDGLMNPGETWTATCSARLDATTTNTAAVAGTDALGREVGAEGRATVQVVNPRLDIVKTPDRTEVRAGSTVRYSYLVTNTGDTALSGVTVVDNLCAPVDPSAVASLAVGASATFSCAMPLQVTSSNFATATGIAPDGLPVLDSAVATVTVRTPAIGITKSADRTVVDPGGQVTYTYVVTNTGDTPLGPVSVTDDTCAAVEPASVATLAPQAQATLRCTTSLAADTVNTAVATGAVPLGGDPVTAQAQASVDVVPSGIEVRKSADPAVIRSGATVTYTYAVRNLGEGPLRTVTVTDDRCSPLAYTGGDADNDGLLDTAETWDYSCTTQIPQDTVNTAVASATTPGGGTVTDTDTAVVDVIFPAIALKKSASPQLVRPGDTVTYTITITNTGDVPLQLAPAGIADTQCQELSIVAGDPAAGPLAVGASIVVQCSARPGATVTNTATVTATDPLGNPVDSSATATVDVQDPRLAVTKTADQPLVAAGTTVGYTIEVTNTAAGPAPLTDVRVADDTCTGLARTGDGNGDAVLDAGETWVYSCTAVITADTVNTATATGTPAVGPEVTSSGSTTVRVKQVDIAVRKTTSTPIVSLGERAAFLIEASNLGPDDATGVVVTDTLEPGLTFVSAAKPADYDPATGRWTVGSLAAGETKSLTLVASIDRGAPTLGNTATRTATAEGDTNPANDSDTAGVVQDSALALTKSAAAATIVAGETTTFTVTLTNQGPSKATNVVVNDRLPAPLEFVQSQPSQGTYDAAAGSWAVGDLAAGASATLVVAARVPAAAPGTYTNVATATSDQQDPDRTPRAEASVTATEPLPVGPTVPPTVPPTGGGGGGGIGGIPGTGAGNALVIAAVGLLLVLGGAGLVLARRRRGSPKG